MKFVIPLLFWFFYLKPLYVDIRIFNGLDTHVERFELHLAEDQKLNSVIELILKDRVSRINIWDISCSVNKIRRRWPIWFFRSINNSDRLEINVKDRS